LIAVGVRELTVWLKAAQPAPLEIIEAVANGDAELAVSLLNVLADPAWTVVGPSPPKYSGKSGFPVMAKASSVTKPS
jgi:hypothetical protein